MAAYVEYWLAMLRCAVRGSRGYYLWMAVLGAGMLGGALAFSAQLRLGLSVTNMSDQVSWGAYIANFTYLVGVAAASVLLVVPSYVYHRSDLKQVVLIGELLAVSAITMCLGFVVVDLGQPERGIHMLPFIGRLNFPSSILAWGRNCAQWLSAAQSSRARIPTLPRVPRPHAATAVLPPVGIGLHCVGCQHSYGYCLSVQRVWWPTVLEHCDFGPTVSRECVCVGAGSVDHRVLRHQPYGRVSGGRLRVRVPAARDVVHVATQLLPAGV